METTKTLYPRINKKNNFYFTKLEIETPHFLCFSFTFVHMFNVVIILGPCYSPHPTLAYPFDIPATPYFHVCYLCTLSCVSGAWTAHHE